jgi:hypothetical protein
MGAVMAVEALGLLVLGVLVVGLLRSHAEILRRLHDLGVGLDDQPTGTSTSTSTTVTLTPPSPRMAGNGAPAITGVTPFDEAAAVSLSGIEGGTVLAFLTTGCTSCAVFWDALAATPTPAGDRVLVVTRGPGDESVGTARKLAKPGIDVVMSSEAWQDYGVPGAPYFVHVDGGSGRVTGEGTARTWEQVLHLLERASSDDDQGEGPTGPWSSDAEREQRIDRELEAAGILPGDPRLHHAHAPTPTDR